MTDKAYQRFCAYQVLRDENNFGCSSRIEGGKCGSCSYNLENLRSDEKGISCGGCEEFEIPVGLTRLLDRVVTNEDKLKILKRIAVTR